MMEIANIICIITLGAVIITLIIKGAECLIHKKSLDHKYRLEEFRNERSIADQKLIEEIKAIIESAINSAEK